MILTNNQERIRFFRFLVVGTIGAVVDFGTMNLLTGLFSVQAIFAQAISFTCAVISNFIWNRYWTYPDSRSKPLRHQLLQFFIVNILGLAIRTPLFKVFEQWFAKGWALIKPPVFSPEFLGRNMALATVVIIVMLWNFFVNRYWTYNDVK